MSENIHPIKAYRLKKNLRQEDFAENIKVTTQTIRNLEADRFKHPNRRVIENAAKEMDLTEEALLAKIEKWRKKENGD